MTDPITDMLNQIKSAQTVGKTEILLPFSKIKNQIALILCKENFVGEVKATTKEGRFVLKISLKYDNGVPAITGFKRISKPGQRIYWNVSHIKKTQGGYGISIISTSKGLMLGREAKKQKIGGEVICQIW